MDLFEYALDDDKIVLFAVVSGRIALNVFFANRMIVRLLLWTTDRFQDSVKIEYMPK